MKKIGGVGDQELSIEDLEIANNEASLKYCLRIPNIEVSCKIVSGMWYSIEFKQTSPQYSLLDCAHEVNVGNQLMTANQKLLVNQK